MNFIQDYRIYSSGDECNPEFHLWSGFVALSACCGPRLWLDMHKFNVNPNLYVVLVGRPGIKKTTAMNAAAKICRKIGDIPIVPPSSTRQAMADWLANEKGPCMKKFTLPGNRPAQYTRASIFASELVNLVETGGDARGFISMLTEIYDPQPNFDGHTIGRGVKSIPYPYITMLGCMTPEITGNLIRENALSGGFSRRCLFVYSDKNGPPVPRPQTTPEQNEAEKRLILRGKQVQQLTGAFEFSPEGYNAYEQWYLKNKAESDRESSQAVVNFLESKATLCLKVAMLLSLSQRDNLIIDSEEMELAVHLVSDIQRHINTVFAGTGRNPHAPTITGIQSYINLKCSSPPHYVNVKKVIGEFFKHAAEDEIRKILSSLALVEPPTIGLLKVKFSGAVAQPAEIVFPMDQLENVKKSFPDLKL